MRAVEVDGVVVNILEAEQVGEVVHLAPPDEARAILAVLSLKPVVGIVAVEEFQVFV